MPNYGPDWEPCGPSEARCIIDDGPDGSRTFFCYNEPVPVCADCPGPGDYLCDYPVGDGKTCDRQMCEVHANEVAYDVHFCRGHFEEFQKYMRSGGFEPDLQNIVRLHQKRVRIDVTLESGMRVSVKKRATITTYGKNTVTIDGVSYSRSTGHRSKDKFNHLDWRIGRAELARINELLCG